MTELSFRKARPWKSFKSLNLCFFKKNIALRVGLKGLKGLLFAERDSID